MPDETPAEPKSIHLWLPSGRSLCDRRDHAQAPVQDDPEARYRAAMDQVTAPVCGSCMLVLGHLRYRAAGLFSHADGQVEPSSPRAAWAAMNDTGWGRMLEISDITEHPEADEVIAFDAVLYDLAPEMAQQATGRFQEDLEGIVAHARVARDQARAERTRPEGQDPL